LPKSPPTETQTPDGLLRKYYALAFVHVASRRVFVSPSTWHPTGLWVASQAAAFVAHARSLGAGPGIVLRDNDSSFTVAFDRALAQGGAESKRLGGVLRHYYRTAA
jgi:putative transposase